MGINHSKKKLERMPGIDPQDIHLSNEGFMDILNKYGPLEVRDDGVCSYMKQINGNRNFVVASSNRVGVYGLDTIAELPPQQ